MSQRLAFFWPYLLAVLSVVLALYISWVVEPYLSISPPFVTFLAAIMLTAWHAGFGPALAATGLSVLVFDYYFVALREHFVPGPADLATLGFFAVQGTLMAYCIVYLQRARHRALHNEEQLHHLHGLSALLFEEQDFEPMLKRVLTAAMELLHADRGFIQLYDEPTRSLSAVAEAGFSAGFLTEFDRVPLTYSTCGAAVERKQRIIVRAIALDPEFSQLTPVFVKYEVVAVQSTPLFRINGEVLGVLSTYFSRPHRPAEDELRLLDLYAHLAERVLETAQKEAALRGINLDLERRVVTKDERLSHLVSELAVTEQRERRHLAGELHDYLAQLLALARMKLRQARQGLTRPAGEADRYIGETDEALQKAIEYSRTLMAELCPPVLHQSGLPAALRWLAGQMPKHGLTVDLTVAHESLPLPEEKAILLFQSVRELLMNVVKHARVQQATVALKVDSMNRLCITVQDRGPGFTPSAVTRQDAGEHFGLASIHERMTLLGGRLDIDSHAGQGTLMTLCLPLQKPSEPDSLRAASSAPHDRVKVKTAPAHDQPFLPLESQAEP